MMANGLYPGENSDGLPVHSLNPTLWTGQIHSLNPKESEPDRPKTLIFGSYCLLQPLLLLRSHPFLVIFLQPWRSSGSSAGPPPTASPCLGWSSLHHFVSNSYFSNSEAKNQSLGFCLWFEILQDDGVAAGEARAHRDHRCQGTAPSLF